MKTANTLWRMEDEQFPESEDFAAAVQRLMVGRKWSWLAAATKIPAGNLRYQLVQSPPSLKLSTALRVGTVLGISVWTPEAVSA